MNLNNFIKDMEPIFICGHRKSGTTLYLNLFDNHNELFTYPHDLNIFYAFENYLKFTKKSNKKIILQRLQKVIFEDLKNKKELKNQINFKKLERNFFSNLKKDKLNIKNIFNTLIFTFKEHINNNKKKVIVKETSLEIYFEEILKLWPNSKFIQVLRDPRDNIGAIMDGLEHRYVKFNDDRKSIIFSSIFRLKHGLELGNHFLKKYPNNFYQSKFEDLITNPTKELKNICRFLKLRYEKSMHYPTVMGESTPGNSHKSEKMYILTKTNIGNWNNRLFEDEIKIIEHSLSDIFKLYNYKKQFKFDQSIKSLPRYYNDINYKYFYYDRF